MSYHCLMVHLELGRQNAGLLRIAGELSKRCQATVIGIAACQPMRLMYGDGYVAGDLVEVDREEMQREMQLTEAEFRSALSAHAGPLEWRSAMIFAPLADHLAREARSADLLLTGVVAGDLFNASRAVNAGDLVLQAGRPVLFVPDGAETLPLHHVLVGWKDTREARRAVNDALPLLKRALRVTLVEIATADDQADATARLQDVASWLRRHGVTAQTLVAASNGNDAAQLGSIAIEHGTDLVVAGAYGHSRLREWALGGVTRELLVRADRCALVSH